MVQEKREYTGKYTVITGASSGIGYEAARAFAERGEESGHNSKAGEQS